MKKNKILALLMALMMVFSLAACGGGGETPEEEDPNEGDPVATGEAQTLTLGFIGPLTGAAALYGTAAANGAQIAVDEIAAADPNFKITLLPMDDEHDGEKAVNAYNNLVDQGAQAIIGTVTTTPCNAVAPLAYTDRMFMLTPSASSPTVLEGRDNVYQLCFSDDNQGSASAQYIFENQLATKVAVIYNNSDAYSTGIYQTFAAEADALGLEVVSVTTFTEDTANDFSVQLADAQSKGADMIFLPIYYGPASMILSQAKSMEFDVKFFGCDGLDGILNREGFDNALAEGLMLLTPFAADAQDPLTQKFVAEYQSRFGETPSQFAADGYDCVYAIYNACATIGVDVSELGYAELCELFISTFSSEAFASSGLTGSGMTWNDKGEVSKEPKAVVIQGGVYVGM